MRQQKKNLKVTIKKYFYLIKELEKPGHQKQRSGTPSILKKRTEYTFCEFKKSLKFKIGLRSRLGTGSKDWKTEKPI